MMHGITSLKVLDPNRGNTAKATDGSATFAEDLSREEERKLASPVPPLFSFVHLLALSGTLCLHTLAVAERQ